MSETKDDYIQDEAANHKPICFYVMNNNIVKEQHDIIEKPGPWVMYHLKPLFIRAKVNVMVVNKVFVDGGATINLMPYSLFKNIGKTDEDLHCPQHGFVQL